MLQLFQSNKLPPLVELLARRTRQMTRGPFDPVTVVVQSFGMGQWLKLRLAEDNGIAGNIHCMLPAKLIWRLYRHVLEDEHLPEESPFSRDSLTWYLMALLPGKTGEAYDQLQHYLAGPGDPQIRLYQLSQQIAGLFDQYLIYRPDWVLAWEQNRKPLADEVMASQAWQPMLWRELLAHPALEGKKHRAHLHRALIETLETCTEPPTGLPRHVSVFGLSALPPMHLDALRAAGRLLDIDVYFLNPCEHYWGDVVSKKDVARRTVRELTDSTGPLEDEDYLQVGNPLLSSLGKQGREFFEALLELDELESHEWFVESDDAGTMLSFTRNDIRRLEFGGVFAPGDVPARPMLDPGDDSIQIHSCHSKLREVEILYDQLLHMFAHDNAVKPRDVMVMMPNVGDYAPYIHAVFKDRLPYSVADRSIEEESPVIVSFLELLELPNSRLTATEVMDFLEVPTIARRFELEDDDLVRIAARINEAGIRFELDGESKRTRWDLPPSNQNTWSFGLRRMMAGYAMESEYRLFEGILPVDMEADDARLAGILHHFIDLLSCHRTRLAGPNTAREWLRVVNDLLVDFYAPEGDEELDLGTIRGALDRLVEQTERAMISGPLSARLFRHWMLEQLGEPGNNRAFLTGGITFGTLIPMRSIPFKVICLLGMNDDEYPRREPRAGFDLMRLDGERKGDRSRRTDDRYLFLEALLSAGRYFYISYEGKSLKDNSAKAPSVLVSELIDYCTAVFGKDCTVEHPLQPFSDDYFDERKPELRTYRNEWYEALSEPHSRRPFVPGPLPEAEASSVLDIEEVARFYRHPAQYFLRQRLGVWFEEDDIELSDSETFSPDPLERYHLAESALAHITQGIPEHEWQRLVIASGAIMDNAVGRHYLETEFNKAADVFSKIEMYLSLEPTVVTAHVDTDDVQVTGRIENVYGGVLLDYRTGALRRRQLLQAWVRHLLLNAAGHGTETLMANAQKGARLPAFEASEASRLLAVLIRCFRAGCREPLPLIPEMSFAYAEAIERGDTIEVAARQALTFWFSERPGAEGKDRNYRRCFEFPDALDEKFHDAAVDIVCPILRAVSS